MTFNMLEGVCMRVIGYVSIGDSKNVLTTLKQLIERNKEAVMSLCGLSCNINVSHKT